ncbi:hypothetical protein J6590_066225 [Homalodisca vitripennis]|nr:hypothetical protein J6590_066225 [Homalodisca vitripennis]
MANVGRAAVSSHGPTPLHLIHLRHSLPIRKQSASTNLLYPDLCTPPSGYPYFRLLLNISSPRSRRRPVHTSSYNSFVFRHYNNPCPIFPRSVRPLRHLTLPCASDKTSRYPTAFRSIPHKPKSRLNTPTCPPNSYIPYVLHNKEYRRVFRNSSHFKQVGTSSHTALRRVVAGTAARSRLTILGVLRMRQPDCYIRETITGTAHSFLGVPVTTGRPPQEALRSSETDHASRLSKPSKRNLSPCAREIRAPLPPRPLEQSKRNLSPCAREISALLR